MADITAFARPEMVVGQPLKILKVYATAIIQCQCPARTTIILVGTAQPDQCPACGQVFAIADGGTVKVGLVAAGVPA